MLVVEDEAMVAMLIEDMLQDLGYEVVDVVARVESALSAARHARFQVAILDVNLGGSSSLLIADVLRERNIPFIFATGYDTPAIGPAYAGVPTLRKPFQQRDLEAFLSRVLAA